MDSGVVEVDWESGASYTRGWKWFILSIISMRRGIFS